MDVFNLVQGFKCDYALEGTLFVDNFDVFDDMYEINTSYIIDLNGQIFYSGPLLSSQSQFDSLFNQMYWRSSDADLTNSPAEKSPN
jgi:hypothetical protein